MTKTVSNAYKGLKGFLSKKLEKYKGVSAGGEEFTHKLDKIMAHSYAKIPIEQRNRPNFLHGSLKDVIALRGDKSLLLYLSGDDAISR